MISFLSTVDGRTSCSVDGAFRYFKPVCEFFSEVLARRCSDSAADTEDGAGEMGRVLFNEGVGSTKGDHVDNEVTYEDNDETHPEVPKG